MYAGDEAKVHYMVMLFPMAATDDNEDKNANCLYKHDEEIVFNVGIGISATNWPSRRGYCYSRDICRLLFASFPLSFRLSVILKVNETIDRWMWSEKGEQARRMIDFNLLSTGERNIAAETCVQIEEDKTTTRQDEKMACTSFYSLFESLSSIMIMTAVERLLAVVGDREKERENLNDNDAEEKKKKRKKCRATTMRCATARTHIYAQSDSG